MVDFVLFLEATQDSNGVIKTRLADVNWLKAPLQGCVLLNILAVLSQRGGTNHVEFAAGQGGFKHIAGVHAAFAFASADHGVDFIDEEDDLASSFFNLFQHAFEAFFKLTAEAGTRQQAGDFQTNEPFILQRRRYVPLDDALRQGLDDGGFTDAGFTDQYGVILGAPAEDLHGAANFFIPADHWVEFTLTRQSGEVGAELL